MSNDITEPTVIEILEDGKMEIVSIGSEIQKVNWLVFDDMVNRNNQQIDEIQRWKEIADELYRAACGHDRPMLAVNKYLRMRNAVPQS